MATTFRRAVSRGLVRRLPVMRCAFRTKRRIVRAALAGLLAFCSLLVVVFAITPLLLLLSDSPRRACQGQGHAQGHACRDVPSTFRFADKAAFVTTWPERQRRPNANSSSTKRVLRWTGFFADGSWEDTDDRYFSACAESRCTMTNDRSLLDRSDAVLFHAGALFNFWRGHVMPDHRLPHQVWILHNVEPPTRSPLNLVPLAGLFNWTATYRLDSDVPVPYGGYTRYPAGDRYGSNHSVNFARRSPRLAAWMSSNCFDYNRRLLIIRRLKELLGSDLDLYGGCGHKRCPETICHDTLSNYKFFFALENANCRHYVTEKFWGALARRQVPVVLGGASSEDYRKIAPPNSFLHVDDFRSLEHLAEHLRELSRDEAAYNRHLRWTRRHEVHSELPARRDWWCRLCRALHDVSRPAQTYTDLRGWVADDVCPLWTFGNQIHRFLDGLRIKAGLL